MVPFWLVHSLVTDLCKKAGVNRSAEQRKENMIEGENCMLTIEYKQVQYLQERERMAGIQEETDASLDTKLKKFKVSSSKHISWRTSSPVKCIHFLPFHCTARI